MSIPITVYCAAGVVELDPENQFQWMRVADLDAVVARHVELAEQRGRHHQFKPAVAVTKDDGTILVAYPDDCPELLVSRELISQVIANYNANVSEHARITKAAAAWLDEWRDEMSSDALEWIDELLKIIEGESTR